MTKETRMIPEDHTTREDETTPAAYEPPAIVTLGTLTELTLGGVGGGGSDGTFTGSITS
jgi:hypothetical protein